MSGRDAPLLRDQQRALHAYEAVASVPDAQRREYEQVVYDLGATILRNGLASALAALERKRDHRARLLLAHLASYGAPGLHGATGETLPARVRALDAAGYMLATRELLLVATWMKRAVQATFGGD